jgi:hypothetical protein
MLKLCDSMSQNAKCEGRFHNPKVGSSSLPPATNPINHLQYPIMTQVWDFSDARFLTEIRSCVYGFTPQDDLD